MRHGGDERRACRGREDGRARRHGHGRAEGPLTLADLGPGEGGRILSMVGPASVQARLRDLGFLEGERVRVIKSAPLSDPVEYCVQGVHIGLRRHEARWILIGEVESCPPVAEPVRGRPFVAALLRELPARLRGRGWGHGRGWGRGHGRGDGHGWGRGHGQGDGHGRPESDR